MTDRAARERRRTQNSWSALKTSANKSAEAKYDHGSSKIRTLSKNHSLKRSRSIAPSLGKFRKPTARSAFLYLSKKTEARDSSTQNRRKSESPHHASATFLLLQKRTSQSHLRSACRPRPKALTPDCLCQRPCCR
jgi:hypothetical protein